MKKKLTFTKKLLHMIILFIIVIALMILGVILYLVITKPFGIDILKIPSAVIHYKTAESTYDHPLLTKDQEVLLESVGVDTKALPTQITNAQIDCATQKLGEERVSEIKAGASPGISDYLKAKECF